MVNASRLIFDTASSSYSTLTRVIPQPWDKIGRSLYRANQLRRKAMAYDDNTAEFYGGSMANITSKNYEKGLRHIWKAEVVAPELGFHDAAPMDKLNLKALPKETATEIRDMTGLIRDKTFKARLSKEYSPVERRAVARLLAPIMHGEAYALYVSASLLPVVKGTGSKMAMSMQVLEEAKHFIVMRELVKAIDKVHPQRFWDQLLLERILRADPMNRLFGMNIVVESVAMNFFSNFATFPGLDQILPFFHLDESRHSAFPQSYTAEVPLSFRMRHSPIRQQERILLVLPMLGLLFDMEEDAKIVNIDIFEFGAKCVDKIFRLSEKSGFYTPLNRRDVIRVYNLIVNTYKRITSPQHFEQMVDLTGDNSLSISEEMKKLEDEIFGTDDVLRGGINRLTEPLKSALFNHAVRSLNRSVAA